MRSRLVLLLSIAAVSVALVACSDDDPASSGAVAATTAAEYSGSALPETEAKIREEKASAKSKPVAATESESGAELH